MKVYYVCKYCDQIYNIAEVFGKEGITEVKGVCNECVLDMGAAENPLSSNLHYYN